jgi:hypothetical protein
MTSLRFMGMGEPEDFRARVYDGTTRPLLQWRDLKGIAHLWPSDGTAGLCGATTAIGEPIELEPGADFGASSADCLACAKAVVR